MRKHLSVYELVLILVVIVVAAWAGLRIWFWSRTAVGPSVPIRIERPARAPWAA